MESKTTEFFADLERETDEMITALNYLLAASEEDNKAFLAYDLPPRLDTTLS